MRSWIPVLVVQLAGDAVDHAKQRVHQNTTGHRGRSVDPLYGVRRTMHTGIWTSSTCKQGTRLEAVFSQDPHAQEEAIWSVYQKVACAYHNPDRAAGRGQLADLIDAISRGVPATLTQACDDLKCSIATLSNIERGHSTNRTTVATYLAYLSQHQTAA